MITATKLKPRATTNYIDSHNNKLAEKNMHAHSKTSILFLSASTVLHTMAGIQLKIMSSSVFSREMETIGHVCLFIERDLF